MSYGPGLKIEFVPYTRFVANKKKISSCISPKFSYDQSQIPTMLLFYNPKLPINCFCNEIDTTFNITFENSLFMVAMLTIKSETFRVRFPTKWQANSNVYFNKMPWYDLLNGYFVDKTTYACSKRFLMYKNVFILCSLFLTDLKSTRS